MRPEEWRKGMENEAASVEDGKWAATARLTARRPILKHNVFSFFAALIVLEVLALLMTAWTANAALGNGFIPSPAGLSNGLLTSLSAMGMAYLLGRLRCLPVPVALGFALFPVLSWLTTTVVFVPTPIGSFGLAPFPDAVPTSPLQLEFSLLGLVTLLARAGLGYFGTQLGLKAALNRRITRAGAE